MAKLASPTRGLSVNARVYDATVRHAVYLERYKNQLVRKVVGLFNRDVVPDLTGQLFERVRKINDRGYDVSPDNTKRLRDLLEFSETFLDAGFKQLNRQFSDDMKRFARVEADWQSLLVRKLLPVQVEWTFPSNATVRAIVENNPFQGRLLSAQFEALSTSTQKKLQAEVNVGLVQGEPVDKIVSRVIGTKAQGYEDGILQTTRRDAETLVRTAAAHVSAQARETTFSENEDLVDSVQMVAVLDSRTTLYCAGIDGKIFKVNEGPRPPFHYNCRTTVVPVIHGWKELGLKAPSESTRASFDGQVQEKKSYEQWLKGQTKEFQDDVLGPSRADLWRKGEFNLDQFTNDKGRTLTLEELKKLD